MFPRPLPDGAANQPLETRVAATAPGAGGACRDSCTGFDAAILVLQGKFGSIQLYDSARGVLEMVAQRGFHEEFLDALATVSIEAGLAGARSIRNRKRVIIPDVDEAPEYEPYRRLAAIAGSLVHTRSTPMLSLDGEVLGALA